jgi:hypothetical protein
MDDGSLSSGFVVKLFAALIGIGIAVLISLLFISSLVGKLGLIGGVVALSVVLLVAGWLYDRREARKDREYGT